MKIETLRLDEFVSRFEMAIAKGYQYVAVGVQVEGYEMPEIIINPYVNFEQKLAYYQNAYDEDGTLKANHNIRLVLISCSNYLDKLNEAVIEYFESLRDK